ncbi:DUF6747 family protein [Maribacter chungangensis]|uniref:DUF6747 family protein n=1 Tax=Maribacter chungangensis TaxID=1069117 RepID=A0ABW3AYA8_9FLAO
MEKILLIREIYLEAFRNWKYLILKNYFKIWAFICFALIGITIYAFIFRLSTGFAFGNL